MSEVKDLAALVNSQQIVEINKIPGVVLPEGYSFESLEEQLSAPKRLNADKTFFDVDSFNRYLKKFCDEDTVIFVNSINQKIKAVIDYHRNQDEPQWGEHRAELRLLNSKAWQAWIERDNTYMSQIEFAEFLENRAEDLVEPTGAELLEIALKFSVVRKAVFGSAIRLASGEFQFQYSDENQKGTIEIPETITLGLQPFHNGQSYEVKARLRYRLKDGVLTFCYKLINADRVIEDAFNEVVEAIKTGVPEASVYAGE